MAFVSSISDPFDSGPASFSMSANSGDMLLAALVITIAEVPSGKANESRVGLPTGWTMLGGWSTVDSGDPRTQIAFVCLAYLNVTATGTISGSFTWPGGNDWHGSIYVMRYSGMVGAPAVAASRMNNQTFRYPAVSRSGTPSATGHAIRMGMGITTYGEPIAVKYVPSGHTARDDTYYGAFAWWSGSRWVWSDQSLSSTFPDAVSSTALTSGWAVTIYIGSTTGPDAPTILTPLSGSTRDLLAASGTPLEWTPSGTQTGVQITRRAYPSGSTVHYLTALTGGSWTATPTTITTSTTTATLPASGFTNGGDRWEIGVATKGGLSAPDLGAFRYTIVTGWAPPSTTGATYDGKSSGTSTTRAGWLVGTGTAGAGSTLDWVEVQLVDAVSGVVYVSGGHGPGWWFPIPTDPPIPNNITVKAKARVRQHGDQFAGWYTSGTITIAQPVPSAPTLVVTATTHSVSGLPGVNVKVTSSAGTVTVYRDGVPIGSWTSTGTLNVKDFGYIPDAPVTYTATVTDSATPPATSNLSAGVAITPATGDGHCWLWDPLHPEVAVQAHAEDIDTRVEHPSSTYYPIDVAAPVAGIVQSLPHHQPTGTITVSTMTPAQYDTAVTLLTSGKPLMWRRWPEHGPDGTLHPQSPLSFVPVGDVQAGRPVSGPYTGRILTFGWVAA